MKRILNLSLALLISTSISTSNSQAAGFATDSHSASGLATSYAGSVTGSHDISDSFFNPAILSDVEDKSELVISATYLNFRIDDDNANSTYIADSSSVSGARNDNAGSIDVIPAFFFATPINEKTTFGMSVTTPFGLSTSYDSNWVGRYYAVDSEIQTVNFNPSISYKVNNKLSIGAGVQAQYLKATLTSMADIGGIYFASPGTMDALAKAKGDDWGYGFNLGATYKVSDELTAGIGYRSKIKHKLEGKTQIQSAAIGNPVSDLHAAVITPETLTLGFKYDVTDKLSLLQDTSWTRWSRVRTLDISAIENSALSSSTNFELKDSFRYSLGMSYNANSKLQLKTGTAYEEGAVDKYRNPRLPGSDKIWLSMGLTYNINNNTGIDLTYVREFYKKSHTNLSASGSVTTDLQSDYKNELDVLAVSLKWNF